MKYARLNMFEEKPYLQLCHKKHAKASEKYDMGLVESFGLNGSRGI